MDTWILYSLFEIDLFDTQYMNRLILSVLTLNYSFNSSLQRELDDFIYTVPILERRKYIISDLNKNMVVCKSSKMDFTNNFMGQKTVILLMTEIRKIFITEIFSIYDKNLFKVQLSI